MRRAATARPTPASSALTVNPASNPDTALQADIVARVPYQPPDRANARAALDYLGAAGSARGLAAR